MIKVEVVNEITKNTGIDRVPVEAIVNGIMLPSEKRQSGERTYTCANLVLFI